MFSIDTVTQGWHKSFNVWVTLFSLFCTGACSAAADDGDRSFIDQDETHKYSTWAQKTTADSDSVDTSAADNDAPAQDSEQGATDEPSVPPQSDLAQLRLVDGEEAETIVNVDPRESCESKTVVTCKVVLPAQNGVNNCFVGFRLCESGAWSECLGDSALERRLSRE